MSEQRKQKETKRLTDIDAIVADYYQRIDRGEAVDIQKLLEFYPEFAEELGAFFSTEQALGLDPPTVKKDEQGTKKTAARIRCPHCQAYTEVANDTPLAEIRCESCDGEFNLSSDKLQAQSAMAISKIGHFEFIELIGSGGFGSVWKARDTKLDREVAVKIPLRNRIDQREAERFFREARTAAQLKHPNIVGVHEIGIENETIYIVCDLIRGVTLNKWLAARRPSNRESAILFINIANALHHAHENGVIHRDLKPSNIMLDDQDNPFLMDFGLARREAGDVTLTMDGHRLGTPAYMSPEHWTSTQNVDRRSDIYALGVMLYELLTGERPFRGDERMLMHQVLHEEPPSPRKLNSRVAIDLETICLKSLEKDPGKRFESASEFAKELDRYVNGEPIHAKPISPVARSWRWCRRKPAAAALLLVLAILAVVGPIIAIWQWRIIERAAIDRESRDFAFYTANLSWADQLWLEGRTGEARTALEACPEHLRSWEFRFLKSLYNTVPTALTRGPFKTVLRQ